MPIEIDCLFLLKNYEAMMAVRLNDTTTAIKLSNGEMAILVQHHMNLSNPT